MYNNWIFQEYACAGTTYAHWGQNLYEVTTSFSDYYTKLTVNSENISLNPKCRQSWEVLFIEVSLIKVLYSIFILQSLTTLKMRRIQALKLSHFQKEKKTCWTENWWSSGITSNFWAEFNNVFRGKKKF